ncbi:hypothetical protein JF66_14320 [Cryobacterium sp. MLB-32]|uniref:three-helix bundle dimerization domain-containing protein n=1 Tax=Cryobacterium sp. MLB-32 TaxID=1529318 RepID=UPI0004E6E536|nr:hypothetical protein [Cryobacterium sp. MLB-32]KFF59015.1 hypothetical protein JF66_14320 [Cryobacterium sp. MLB-32]
MGLRTEQQNILNVVERLEARFPLVSSTRVEQVVASEYAKLSDSRVRTYVSILVEHSAKDRLSGHTTEHMQA